MHIMEGFLPVTHAIGWSVAAAPFVLLGAQRVRTILRDHPQERLNLAAAGAFAFVLSALKLPSVTGSCSHPTGVGLGAVLFGPLTMTLLGSFVLLFQTLLLAHGGLTTLGANIISMAVVGPFVSYGIWRLARPLGAGPAVFLAACLGDVATYCTTALQLALAFPDAEAGILGALIKFGSIFAVTQLPLAVAEGLVTVVVMNALSQRQMVGVRA